MLLLDLSENYQRLLKSRVKNKTYKMILPETKKIIYLNAGHFDDPGTQHIEDPGAKHLIFIELTETMKIRDVLVPKLKIAGFKVFAVPDDLNLRHSIDWTNDRAKGLNDGLALDIHLNHLSDKMQRGTEAFYGTSDTTKQVGEKLCEKVSVSLNTLNRRAKPDTMSGPGELGWIRQTNCWASLLEVCFLTNVRDMAALHAEGGYNKVATAITEAIAEIFGVELKKDDSSEIEKETIAKLSKENYSLWQVINLLIEYISSFFKRK